jgi:3-isopropylmalate dehydrogenase
VIVTLPGDGIGPEILDASLEVLRAVAPQLEYEPHLFGGAAIDAHGTALTDETLAACRGADAVLLAAVGGPKWDTTDPSAPRPEQGLLGLRKGLGLFANLRPVRPVPALYDASPLKRELIERTDLLVVRELTGGIYFGESGRGRDGLTAFDTCTYSVAEIERIARRGFESCPQPRDERRQGQRHGVEPAVARGGHARALRGVPQRRARAPAGRQRRHAARLAAVGLRRHRHGEPVWRHPLRRGGDAHRLDRDAAERLARGPRDPGAVRAVHGSAPDIAGRGIANPLAMFLSAALMLRHALGSEEEAAAVESAVDRALAAGLRTADLGGSATTAEATRAVLGELS